MCTAGAKDVQGIKRWIRLSLVDMERLCRSRHLGGEYVHLLMRQIIRERAEAAFEDSIRDLPGLTPGQTSCIRQHCLDFYTALLNEVARETGSLTAEGERKITGE